MGRSQRNKGKRGECSAKHLLLDRDWEIIADTSAGLSTDDLIALCPQGILHSVEVKNTRHIKVPEFRRQAIENARKRPWLLLMKLDGTRAWLVMGRNRKPEIWNEKGASDADMD